MAISFPTSPSLGQSYTVNGTVWTWNGSSWEGSATEGPQGPQGPAGATGPAGPTGATGPAGTTNYNDLTNKPTIPTVSTAGVSGDYNDLTNKPSLFSGAYADLTGKPALFSGSYNDLTNKPTIPTVSTAGASGDYNDLINKPTIPTSTNQLTNDSGFLTSVGWTAVTGKPSFASVATSGDYNDLINKPTSGSDLPANASGYLVNDGTGNLSWAAGDGTFSGDYNDLVNKPTIPDLTGYATESWVQSQGYGSSSGTTNEITNTDGYSTYSVSVGTDGVVTMTTSRGSIEFGALPEVGGPTHLHIMKSAGQGTDLFFGDDYNYVRQRPAAYGSDPGYGVEIGTNDNNGGSQHVWRFDIDGTLILPAGGDIKDSNGISVLSGGSGTTVPSYKGFKAHYGSMYNNNNDPNGPINKLVIYKDTATPSSTIDESTNDDTFTVTGLSGSDVVAMLVVISDNVTQTATADLKTFAEAIIDNVILDGGVEGNVRSADGMKTAFYNNFSNFNSIIPSVKTGFEFFSTNNQFNINPYFSTGNGANFSGIAYNMGNDTLDLGSWGQGDPHTHTVGDVYVIPGNTIQDANGNYLLTPDNDVTVTVTAVTDGWIQTVSVTGSLPRPQQLWPSNYMSDGGDDEYDGGNYISTDLGTEISYNNGNTVYGSSEFGGGDYVVTYNDGIFGVFASGANINLIKTDGGSGFDGDGVGVTGSLYGDSGASVTTGDITFDASRLSSPSTGSGNFPLGVITLAPGNGSNSNFADYGQFINVYPTTNFDQPHIHIAPGQGNNGTGNLILGDDNYHIDISNNGYIYIKTNNQNNTWTFDDNGNLTLPNGGDIRDSNGNSVLGGGFSGDYNDLTNKPTIPADTGDLTNNAGFITSISTPTFEIKSSNFTADAGKYYAVNTSSGSVTVTLPTSPTVGQSIQVVDAAGTWPTNKVYVIPANDVTHPIIYSGTTYGNGTTYPQFNFGGISVSFFWNGTNWRRWA